MNDSDSEYEETEYLVFADFKKHLAPHQYEHKDAAIKIIGIESETPMAEINGSIFKGSYDMAMGTLVFFEKDNDSAPRDPLYEPVCRQMYKYVDKTDKVINFEGVYIDKQPQEQQEPKTEQDQDQEMPEDKPQTLKLNINYRDAINKFGEEQ
ncbi:hypothetical protein KR222_006535 [Zaprionus bogoriensis]|nr:hypothetical protein KR222_006535 [Zaprionus bogoriensis]